MTHHIVRRLLLAAYGTIYILVRTLHHLSSYSLVIFFEEYTEGMKNLTDGASDFFDTISAHRAKGGLTVAEIFSELFRELPQVKG